MLILSTSEVVGPRTGRDVEVSVRMCDKCSLVGRQLCCGVNFLIRGLALCPVLVHRSLKMLSVDITTVHPFIDEGSWVRRGERI